MLKDALWGLKLGAPCGGNVCSQQELSRMQPQDVFTPSVTNVFQQKKKKKPNDKLLC